MWQSDGFWWTLKVRVSFTGKTEYIYITVFAASSTRTAFYCCSMKLIPDLWGQHPLVPIELIADRSLEIHVKEI